jgi:hypothetical protein
LALAKRQRLAAGDGENRKTPVGRSNDPGKPQAFEAKFGCRFAFRHRRRSPSRVEKRPSKHRCNLLVKLRTFVARGRYGAPGIRRKSRRRRLAARARLELGE